MNKISHSSIIENGLYKNINLVSENIETAKSLYKFMLRLRACEDRLSEEYHPADEMRCPVHFCVGQESVPAAISAILDKEDFLFSHHRSHGYYLAKHAPMNALFAELYGKETGANGGIAGSQDISYLEKNFFSGAILAGAIALAMGAALGIKIKKQSNVVVVGFGEAATDEGVFWETVNYAGRYNLPIIFICENNKYSVFSPQEKRNAKDNLSERVATFGVRSSAIFGNDAILTHDTLLREYQLVKSGKGPSFIEAYTYRWSGHYGPASDDLVGYRDQSEIDSWKDNCPIKLLKEALINTDNYNEKEFEIFINEVNLEINNSFRYAKESKFPHSPNWEDLNWQKNTPLSDKLLREFDVNETLNFSNVEQIKGY